MNLDYENEGRMVYWAEQRIPGVSFSSHARAIGVPGAGAREYRGVVVFHRFSSWDCEMCVASDGRPGWLTRALIVAAFAFPFGQLRLERVTATVSDNPAAARLCKHLGFLEEGVLRRLPPHSGVTVLGLLRSECRWIPPDMRRD